MSKERLFHAGELKAIHKTNLQLFQDCFRGDFTKPAVFRELQERRISYIFNGSNHCERPTNRQEMYDCLKHYNIDFLYIRGKETKCPQD